MCRPLCSENNNQDIYIEPLLDYKKEKRKKKKKRKRKQE
jgi:hypothetical protein